MCLSVSAERLRKVLVALTVFTVVLIAVLYWGRLEDLQPALRINMPR